MHKKLMVACMAIASIAAFAVAPPASASPVLTDEGKSLAVGTSVTGNNTGNFSFTGGFALTCEDAHFQGSVLKNSGLEVEMTVPVGGLKLTNAGGGPCASAFGSTTYTLTSELCIRNIPKTDSFTISGCGTNPITFDMAVAGITCKYSSATWVGTFTTNSTPVTLKIWEQIVAEEEPRQVFCPDEGKWDLDFDLYTTGGSIGLAIS